MSLIYLLLPLWVFASPFERQWENLDWLKEAQYLAIQSGGRVKPLDTFAREGLELLTGKEKFKGKTSVEILFSLSFEPHVWQEIKFLQIGYQPLKKDLALNEKESFFSPQELMHVARLMPLFQELDAKVQAKEKLDTYFQSVQRLANQMGFLQEIVNGRALRLIPPTAQEYEKSDAWHGFDSYSNDQKMFFALLGAGFTSEEKEVKGKLKDYVAKFAAMAKANNLNLYPTERDLWLEVHFNKLRPFRWAWVFALFSTVFLTFAFYNPKKHWLWLGYGTFAASFLIQSYGFFLRSYISGHPPVTNMYESVVWVAFGAMAFGAILEWVYRQRIVALGSLIFATLALIISDSISGVVDDGIHPLEPVLRSNLWLTVHVLTITLGYAAFAISLILGNMGMAQWAIWRKESLHTPLRQLAFLSYRAVQIGVVLLAAGTILGGVWADYSWGRFWGWDPKETWALIALLGYLALLHARFRGMVGHFGFLAGCVVAFLGVLMAWYGVNFVLGAGLHSYGFSSGGVSYVATYCTLQLLFVAWAAYARKSSRRIS